MSLIAPQIVAMARVKIEYADKAPSLVEAAGPKAPSAIRPTKASYVFSNGFDAERVSGTVEGVSPIFSRPGQLMLFLAEPLDPGSRGAQGGMKVRIDMVDVSTPEAPSPPPFRTDVKIRWVENFFFLDQLLPLYRNVDPRKAIFVNLLRKGKFFTEPATLDIVVAIDPMVSFAGKVSEVK